MQISNVNSANQATQSVFTGARNMKLNPNDMRERMRAQAREAKLREREDEMIKNLKQSITEVSKSGLDKEIIDARIETLSAQIQSIYDNRAEREKQAREAELQKQKEAAEEASRKQEENQNKNKSDAEPEEEGAISREDMEGMVKLSVSHQGVSAAVGELKKTRATMAMEAEQLSQDISHDAGRESPAAKALMKPTPVTNQVVLEPNADRSNLTRANGEGYRERQLERLNTGISSLETAINEKVAQVNRDVNDVAEEKAAERPGGEEQTRADEEPPLAEQALAEQAAATFSLRKPARF